MLQNFNVGETEPRLRLFWCNMGIIVAGSENKSNLLYLNMAKHCSESPYNTFQAIASFERYIFLSRSGVKLKHETVYH